MTDSHKTFDRESLNLLQERLKRGIPKWEQEAFIEHVRTARSSQEILLTNTGLPLSK